MLGYFLRFKLKSLLIFVGSFLFVEIILSYYSDRVKSYPIILWWTPDIALESTVIKCSDNYKCLLTRDRRYQNSTHLKANLFYGSRLNLSDLPLPKTNDWALFHEESPKNSAMFIYDTTQQIFDFVATFSRYSDLPLTLQYLQSIDNITDTHLYVDIQLKNNLLSTQAPIVYIQSSCDTPNNRDVYVRELMNYIKIDSFGECLKNKQFPKEIADIHLSELYDEKLLKFIAKYKFVIAFENAECEDYITEKLWRPLMVGSVPIYLGSPSITDWLPNSDSAILVNDFKSPQLLADYIKLVGNNDELYLSFLKHKFGIITNQLLKSRLATGPYGLEKNEEIMFAFSCAVCKNFHEGFQRRGSESIYDCMEPKDVGWKHFWEMGKSQSEALYDSVKSGKIHSAGQKQ